MNTASTATLLAALSLNFACGQTDRFRSTSKDSHSANEQDMTLIGSEFSTQFDARSMERIETDESVAMLVNFRNQISINVEEWLRAYADARFGFDRGCNHKTIF
jgi:hypothetical protein